MSTPEPPANSGTPTPVAGSPAPTGGSATGSGAASAPKPTPVSTTGGAGQPPSAPPPRLTGWRSVFEHTGIPRSVLTWKPRMPSRNWTIFLTVVGTLSYVYYDDRRKCKQIREEYTERVKYLAQQPTSGSFEQPRKVMVYAARWPEDDDLDRGLRYFRKYVKPYLVAAAIDYEQFHAPIYGSVTRAVRANIVRKRREALGLQEREQNLAFPGADETAAQRELEGGIVLVGRPSLKEFLAGQALGWNNGVNEWVWEKEIEGQIAGDGVFDEPVLQDQAPSEDVEPAAPAHPSGAPASPLASASGLSFLQRPTAPLAIPTAPEPATVAIPDAWHAPPSPLPAQPPVLLVPFTNYLGFKQIPWMIYGFFTEHKKVQAGADAAMALIENETRPMEGPTSGAPLGEADTDFGLRAEEFYKSKYFDLQDRVQKARDTYYKELEPRLESARQFARGERGLTDEEKKSDKPIVTEDALREERRKKELRWRGTLEGFNIVKPDTPVEWQPNFEGWLRVYDTSREDKKPE